MGQLVSLANRENHQGQLTRIQAPHSERGLSETQGSHTNVHRIIAPYKSAGRNEARIER